MVLLLYLVCSHSYSIVSSFTVLRAFTLFFFFFFKQKTAYEMRISDWSSDVCSSDLRAFARWSIGSSPGPPMCCVRRHRCRRALRFASPGRQGNSRCRRRRGGGPSRNGNRSRLGSNASCSRPTRNGSGSACWRSEEHTSELQSLMRISYAVFCLK